MPRPNPATIRKITPPQSRDAVPTVGAVTTVGVTVAGVDSSVGVEVKANGVAVGGAGVGVTVAGGVTSNNNFWFGRIMDEADSPFQAIKLLIDTPYRPAIHERVSPLWTVW